MMENLTLTCYFIGLQKQLSNSNIEDIKGTRLKRGNSWIAKAEIKIVSVTPVDVTPRGAE